VLTVPNDATTTDDRGLRLVDGSFVDRSRFVDGSRFVHGSRFVDRSRVDDGVAGA